MCRGIKWRFTILSCVIAQAETAESEGKQPLLQSAELMIKFACIILDFCSCLVFILVVFQVSSQFRSDEKRLCWDQFLINLTSPKKYFFKTKSNVAFTD